MTAPFGSLVGSIGGNFLRIGTSFAGTGPASGNLRLYDWHTFTADDTQFVTAFVDPNPAPEPGTFVLAGLGLMAFSRFRRRGR